MRLIILRLLLQLAPPRDRWSWNARKRQGQLNPAPLETFEEWKGSGWYPLYLLQNSGNYRMKRVKFGVRSRNIQANRRSHVHRRVNLAVLFSSVMIISDHCICNTFLGSFGLRRLSSVSGLSFWEDVVTLCHIKFRRPLRKVRAWTSQQRHPFNAH